MRNRKTFDMNKPSAEQTVAAMGIIAKGIPKSGKDMIQTWIEYGTTNIIIGKILNKHPWIISQMLKNYCPTAEDIIFTKQILLGGYAKNSRVPSPLPDKCTGWTFGDLSFESYAEIFENYKIFIPPNTSYVSNYFKTEECPTSFKKTDKLLQFNRKAITANGLAEKCREQNARVAKLTEVFDLLLDLAIKGDLTGHDPFDSMLEGLGVADKNHVSIVVVIYISPEPEKKVSYVEIILDKNDNKYDKNRISVHKTPADVKIKFYKQKNQAIGIIPITQ